MQRIKTRGNTAGPACISEAVVARVATGDTPPPDPGERACGRDNGAAFCRGPVPNAVDGVGDDGPRDAPSTTGGPVGCVRARPGDDGLSPPPGSPQSEALPAPGPGLRVYPLTAPTHRQPHQRRPWRPRCRHHDVHAAPDPRLALRAMQLRNMLLHYQVRLGRPQIRMRDPAQPKPANHPDCGGHDGRHSHPRDTRRRADGGEQDRTHHPHGGTRSSARHVRDARAVDPQEGGLRSPAGK